jgi:RimJ/RimL family protein N-acetyltransferase
MSMVYGERLRLRRAEREDITKFHEWVNDPEVTEGLSLLFPMSIEDEEHWYQNTLNQDIQERPFSIEVHTDDGWRLIGNCSFFGIEREARSSEIGIMIGDKSMWNQGLGTESMKLLLRIGFETLNLNRIFLRVYSDNLRAKRSYEKAGFVLEGTMRQAVYKKGKYGDVHIMSVLRSEWDKGKK